MSTFSTQLSHGSPYVSINILCYEQSYDIAGNYSVMYWYAYTNTWNGSRSGTWDWNAYVNGTYVGGGSVSATWSGEHGLGSGTIVVYHDANGYANPSCSAYLDDYYAQATASGYPGTTRLPLAPTISSTASSNIKPTTATIAASVSSNGHGTSTTITYFYRISGSGSYTNAGTGSSKALTGLKPGTTYEWYVTAVNNNGDTATSSVQTFKTKGIAGLLPILMALTQG